MLETFTALADPNRLRIIDVLRRKPLTVGEIVERIGIPQPQVSKHLRVLKEAGLVSVESRAQFRHYELRTQPLREIEKWLEKYRG